MRKGIVLAGRSAAALLMTAAIVAGCSSQNVRRAVVADDLYQYTTVYISDARVYSEEQNAATNEELQRQMAEYASRFRTELAAHFTQQGYRVVDAMPASSDSVLVAELDMNLAYGSRAARYWVGMGAGQGGVTSSLTMTDARTGAQKFFIDLESALTGGWTGGNMMGVLEDAFAALVAQYPSNPSMMAAPE
jgi:Domain of unknown function (DUF4410)